MDVIVAILIIVGVIVFATVLLGIWLAILGISLFVSIIKRMFGGGRARQLPPPIRGVAVPQHWRVCSNQLCAAQNPPGARFCRRCGQREVPAVPVTARRVAAW